MKRLAAAIAMLGLAACGQAAGVRIEKAEYRAPLGASGVGAAYFSITSAEDDVIIGVSSPRADLVEIHATVTNGAQTAMKRLDSVPLPAGKTVTFGPGGAHLMVFAPKPLAEGATFPIQIDLESGRSETFEFHPALIGGG